MPDSHLEQEATVSATIIGAELSTDSGSAYELFTEPGRYSMKLTMYQGGRIVEYGGELQGLTLTQRLATDDEESLAAEMNEVFQRDRERRRKRAEGEA